MFSALNGSKWHQPANSCVTACQNKHVCSAAQACGRVAKMKCIVNIVGVKVGVNLIPIKLIHYNQQLEWVEWRCCQTNENSHRIAGAAVSWLISMPRSCRRSSTLRSESGKRTYSITAKRIISGLVLKYLNGECFVIRRGYETTLPVSTSFCLTVPSESIAFIAQGGQKRRRNEQKST